MEKLWLGGGAAPLRKLPKLIVSAVWLAVEDKEALAWSMTVSVAVVERFIGPDAPGSVWSSPTLSERVCGCVPSAVVFNATV